MDGDNKNLCDIKSRISARTYNCMKFMGMETLGDVYSLFVNGESRLEIRNFGAKSYSELSVLLLEYGYVDVPPYRKSGKKRKYVMIEMFTINEGDYFIPWTGPKKVYASELDQRDALYVVLAGQAVHSLRFIDGQEWDCVNGYRRNKWTAE